MSTSSLASTSVDPVLQHIVGLIGRMTDELTAVLNRVLGTDWATNEEVLVFAHVALNRGTTTHRLSEISGLQRRALSRFVGRLVTEQLFRTGTLAEDRRRVTVDLTARGRRTAKTLGEEFASVLEAEAPMLRKIAATLGSGQQFAHAGSGRLFSDPIEILERMAQVGHAYAAKLDELTPEVHLSGRQRGALFLLSADTGMGVRPGPLASSLHMTRAGAGYVVDQLIEMGFAERKVGAFPDDMRAVLIEATPQGQRFIDAATTATVALGGVFAELFYDLAAWADLRRSNEKSVSTSLGARTKLAVPEQRVFASAGIPRDSCATSTV